MHFFLQMTQRWVRMSQDCNAWLEKCALYNYNVLLYTSSNVTAIGLHYKSLLIGPNLFCIIARSHFEMRAIWAIRNTYKPNFSPISTNWFCLQFPQLPRTRHLAIFVTTTTTDGQIDCFMHVTSPDYYHSLPDWKS